MLFKRIIERKSMLNADSKSKTPEKCSRSRSEYDDGFGIHSTTLDETMKMVMVGVVLWAVVGLSSYVSPYPFSLIVTSGITHPPPMYDFPFPSAEMLKKLPPITAANTNRSIAISKLTVSMLERLEDNLHGAGITPAPGSAAQGLLIQGYPSSDAMHYEKSAMIIAKASTNLVVTRCTRYGLPTDECATFISTLNIRDSEYGDECAVLEGFACRAQKLNSRYRSVDGSCNNPVRSSWGQALTGYKRLLHPRYSDGIEQPRRAKSNHALPSARLVSTQLANNLDHPDEKITIAFAIWSQFVFHDLTHTPIRKMIHNDSPIRCCDNTGYVLTPRYVHPSCMPITVPREDPFFGEKYITCMEYTRSVTTYRGDCTFGAAEQMNQATHFLDGSHIYGTNSREAAALRDKHGLLKTEIINGEEYPPQSTEPIQKCMLKDGTGPCFHTGDVRANMHPWLTSMHVVWLREHNRIARALADMNPGWSSDKLYHEARRIVIAELQHITYRSWMPALTGKTYDELYDSYDTGYNQEVDPTITNAFATATSHFVHSLLDEDIEVIDSEGKVTSQHKLSGNYYKPQLLLAEGLEGILRGMVNQQSQGLDFNYDNDVWRQWLGGLDALAVDVQRGRDHGLSPYVHYRVLCGSFEPTQFHQLTDLIPEEVVEKLAKLYEDPSDIDLVVGAMAETPLPGSLLGPTFTCIMKEQLWRTRAGDRYFYAHAEEGGFNRRQLSELRRATLARVLCDNSPVKTLSRDVFAPPSLNNPQMSCDEIKRVNLQLWQDPSQQPDLITRTQQNVNKWIKNKVGVKDNKI